MITYSNANNDAVWELRGLSTDEKPTTDNIPNGSSFREMDTGAVFLYDGESKEWLKQPISSGSGDNGGGETEPGSGEIATDEEINDALDDIFG